MSEKYVISVKETEDSFCIESDDLNDSFIKEFTAKLNDFNLRSELENKSQELKSLIIAKAFYPEMISIEPTGKFEDPVMMDNNDKAVNTEKSLGNFKITSIILTLNLKLPYCHLTLKGLTLEKSC